MHVGCALHRIRHGAIMIAVEVKLFATLRRQFPDWGIGEGLEAELAEGATVYPLMGNLQLLKDHVKVVFVNNAIQRGDYALSDGDAVRIFPPVGG